MKTIIIFGSNGMLGNYIKLYFKDKYNIIALTRQDYDLNNLNVSELQDVIKKYINDDTIIINCAGIIPQSVEHRSVDDRMFYRVNSIFPILLGMFSKIYNFKLIHVTSDCVFSGKCGNYNELSKHDSNTSYGISKSLGEIVDQTIIRTSIIGEENFNKLSLIEFIKSRKNNTVNGYVNHYWNGVTCLQLAKIINKMIDENIFWTGVRHIYSPRIITKYELTEIVNESFDLNLVINKYETEHKVDRSMSSIYESLFEIPDLVDQIKEIANFRIY